METGFTNHCLERMRARNISEEDLATVLKNGFFRDQPKNEAYAVEYGSIVVVVGYDGTFITTYRTSSCGKYINGGFFRRTGKKWRRHKVSALKIADSKQEIMFAWHQTGKDFQDGHPLQQTEAM